MRIQPRIEHLSQHGLDGVLNLRRRCNVGRMAGRLVQLLSDVQMLPYKSVFMVYGQRELLLRMRFLLEVLEISMARWAGWNG